MSQTKRSAPPSPNGHGRSSHAPAGLRMQYFYGQMLAAEDFRTEQAYFREKIKLLNRCLHGWGVVCGLEVEPVPTTDPCPPASGEGAGGEREEVERRRAVLVTELRKRERDARERGPGEEETDAERADRERAEAEMERLREEIELLDRRLEELEPEEWEKAENGEWTPAVRILPGIALDCEGNELPVRSPIHVDLLEKLSARERERLRQGAETALYVSLCYAEIPVDPTRPVLSDACGASPSCTYGRIQESVCVRVSTEEPERDDRCGGCCEPCGDPCVLLARIDGLEPGRPMDPDRVRNEVRRPVSVYQPTAIVEVNWRHGAEYSLQEGEQMLEEGLEVRFSRPVLVETLVLGVVDLWVLEGGVRQGNLEHVPIEYVGLPDEGTTDRLRFKAPGADVTRHDRVVITVRSSHILDECCHAVDGDNIGAWVRMSQEREMRGREATPPGCLETRRLRGALATGNGVPGGTFESWFFISGHPRETES